MVDIKQKPEEKGRNTKDRRQRLDFNMGKSRPVDTSRFQHLYPFASHYMDLDGLKYHYVDEGSGDPIVMIHGNPTWSFYYRELIKALSSKYRTIVPDHIGCGLSDKPDLQCHDYRLKSRVDDLERLLDNLNVTKNVTLILHDWGGMIGMAYALRHSERIRRLAIMNTFAFLPPAEKPIPKVAYFIRHFGPLAALAVLGLNLFAIIALYKNTYKGLTPDVKKGLTAPYNCWKNRIALLKFVQDIPLSQNDSSYEIVKQVDENLQIFSDIPMLICWGEHDFVFDHYFLMEWKRRFPEAEVHTFAEAGHYVLEDVPDRIIKVVSKFLINNPLP